MLSVATLLIIISGIAIGEGLHGMRTQTDDVVLFGAVLTTMLGLILGIVGVLWWFGWFGMPAAPYLLPSWDVLFGEHETPTHFTHR